MFWKLGANKRVPTRELATSLPGLSASSVNCLAGLAETLSRSSLGIRSLRWCLWHKKNWLTSDVVRFAAPALLEHNQKGRRRSTPSCCRPENDNALAKSKRTGNLNPAMLAGSSSPHPGFMERRAVVDCNPGHDQGPIWVLLPSRLARCRERWRRRNGGQGSATELRLWRLL